jgi:hypothetical protein
VVTLGLYTLFTFLANVAETAIGVVVLFLDQRLNCVDMIWNKKILINYYVMQNMLML